MNSVSALIVDDESAARSRLKRLLGKDNRINVLGEAEDGPGAVQAIQQYKPQLVFLDIQMPAMNGFDVLRLLSPEQVPAVVFVTAFDEYAVKAFDVAAVDYLLKPFDEERLRGAVDKVIASLTFAWDKTVVDILDRLETKNYCQQLPVHHLKRIRLLNVTDISYIVSEHRLINLYDKDGQRYWTNETLEQLENRLDPTVFFRIHRSSLISLQATFEIETWDDGRLRLHYPDGTILVVARGPAKELKSLLSI
ncbi:MAG: LytR/AlgR family response regulator transcription factor [Pseudomonadales bacterium]